MKKAKDEHDFDLQTVFQVDLCDNTERYEVIAYMDELYKRGFKWAYPYDRYYLNLHELQKVIIIIVNLKNETINVLYDFEQPETIELKWAQAKLHPVLNVIRGLVLAKKFI